MSATAIAHPNVALIKYWGKRDRAMNLPAVGSLSITLAALATESTVDFEADVKRDTLILDGIEQPGEAPRLGACLDALRAIAGDTRAALIQSRNDFPTGAGLASSASGYAALVTAGAEALGISLSDPRLPGIARIGSGSAARSMQGGIVLLRNAGQDTSCEQLVAADAWPLEVTVAVTTEGSKVVTSRDGMEQSRLSSPYYSAWLETHERDLSAALEAVQQRDFERLGEISEHNCLKMHAVMFTSRPPLMYWTPTTLACLQAIRDLRADGVPVFFTVDAGPQVKAVHLADAAAAVRARLAAVPGVLRLIHGGLGDGARLTS